MTKRHCKTLMHVFRPVHERNKRVLLQSHLSLLWYQPSVLCGQHDILNSTELAENLTSFLCRRTQPWPSPVLIGNGTSKYRVSRLTVGYQISTMCTLPTLISQKAPLTARRARSSARSLLSLWVRNAAKPLLQLIDYLVKQVLFGLDHF